MEYWGGEEHHLHKRSRQKLTKVKLTVRKHVAAQKIRSNRIAKKMARRADFVSDKTLLKGIICKRNGRIQKHTHGRRTNYFEQIS